MKPKEILPMTIPVICHVYGIDKDYDLMERSTILFDEISYHITRLSHGLVNYQNDSFVRVEKELDDISVKKLWDYLSWAKGQSIYDRKSAGYEGEFWIFSDHQIEHNVQTKSLLPTYVFDLSADIDDAIAIFYWRMCNANLNNTLEIRPDSIEKYLARIPDVYWYNMVQK